MDYSDKFDFISQTYEMVKTEYLKNRMDNILKHSPYSMKINKAVFTVEEIELYKLFKLTETVVTRPALVAEIDLNFKDQLGKTNLQRMLDGKPPIDPITGTVYIIHHIGQKYDAPFAEIPKHFHSKKFYSALHKKHIDSWRADKKLVNLTNNEFAQHWQLRGKQYNASERLGT